MLNGSCAAWAGSIIALWGTLEMVLVLAASPVEAAPFAYGTNSGEATISVIDTTTNTLVAALETRAAAVPVNPDGKHAVNIIGSTGASLTDLAFHPQSQLARLHAGAPRLSPAAAHTWWARRRTS